MNQAELIELMEKWQETDPALYKQNIRKLCEERKIYPAKLAKLLGIKYSTAKSYFYQNHPSKIEFLTALKIAELLKVDVREFLKGVD